MLKALRDVNKSTGDDISIKILKESEFCYMTLAECINNSKFKHTKITIILTKLITDL